MIPTDRKGETKKVFEGDLSGRFNRGKDTSSFLCNVQIGKALNSSLELTLHRSHHSSMSYLSIFLRALINLWLSSILPTVTLAKVGYPHTFPGRTMIPSLKKD